MPSIAVSQVDPVKIKKSKKSKTSESPAEDVIAITPETKESKKEKKKKAKRSSDEIANSDSEVTDKKAKKSKKTVDETGQSPKGSEKKIKKDKKSKKSSKEEKEAVAAVEPVDASIPIEEDASMETEPAVEEKTPEIPVNEQLETHNLSPSTLNALKERGITHLFPIQAAAFGPIMEGKDILGRARTGTGKTLAFSLPIVETLKKARASNMQNFTRRGRAPKALIMAPTRELAIQVHKEIVTISAGELKTLCVYGGVPYDNQCMYYLRM